MKSTLITIAIILLVFLIALFGHRVQDAPMIYRGQIVNRVHDSFIVQVVVPATEDELIGYEIGDEYLLQEVDE